MPTTNPPVDGLAALALRGIRVRRADGFEVSLPDLALPERGVAALVGPSGCGKTTMLWGVLGLLPDVSVVGTREILGAPWPDPGTTPWRQMLAGPVTIVMQDARSALDPLQRIGVQVATVTGREPAQVEEALGRFGLVEPGRVAQAWPHEISGGQAQKVLLAIALLRAPRLLVMDEPTASLDGASVGEWVAHLELLQAEHGTAVLVATHDLSLVEALAACRYDYDGAGSFCRADPDSPPLPGPSLPTTGEVVLQVCGVKKSFEDRCVLRGVDLEVAQSEVVAVVGPSGCGKTTLARILVGELAPDAGDVRGARGAQLLSQDAYASLTPGRTVRSLLDETAVPGFDVLAEAASLGLTPVHLGKSAERLSGGERRRAALLRALSVGPPLLILDEPTASLDRARALDIMNLLIEVQRRRGLACLWVTHDLPLAHSFAHRVLQMRDGRFQ